MGPNNRDTFFQGLEIECGFFAASGELWVKNKSNSALEEIQIYPDFPDLTVPQMDRFTLAPFETKHLKLSYSPKQAPPKQARLSWNLEPPDFSGSLVFIYKSMSDLCIQPCPIALPAGDSNIAQSQEGHISADQAAFYHLSAMITEFKTKALGFDFPYLIAQLQKIKNFLTGSAFRQIRQKVIAELESVEILLTTIDEHNSDQIDRRRDEIVDRIENQIDMFLMGLTQA